MRNEQVLRPPRLMKGTEAAYGSKFDIGHLSVTKDLLMKCKKTKSTIPVKNSQLSIGIHHVGAIHDLSEAYLAARAG